MPRIIPSSKKRKGIAGKKWLSEKEIRAVEQRAAAPFIPFGKDISLFDDRSETGCTEDPLKTPPNKIPPEGKITHSLSSVKKKSPSFFFAADPVFFLRDEPDTVRMEESGAAHTVMQGSRDAMSDEVEENFHHRLDLKVGGQANPCSVDTEGIGREVQPCLLFNDHFKQMEELKSKYQKQLESKEEEFEKRENVLQQEILELKNTHQQIRTRLSRLLTQHDSKQSKSPEQSERVTESLDSVVSQTEEAMRAQTTRIRDLEESLHQTKVDLQDQMAENQLLIRRPKQNAATQTTKFVSSDLPAGTTSVDMGTAPMPVLKQEEHTPNGPSPCKSFTGFGVLLERLEMKHGKPLSNSQRGNSHTMPSSGRSKAAQKTEPHQDRPANIAVTESDQRSVKEDIRESGECSNSTTNAKSRRPRCRSTTESSFETETVTPEEQRIHPKLTLTKVRPTKKPRAHRWQLMRASQAHVKYHATALNFSQQGKKTSSASPRQLRRSPRVSRQQRRSLRSNSSASS